MNNIALVQLIFYFFFNVKIKLPNSIINLNFQSKMIKKKF